MGSISMLFAGLAETFGSGSVIESGARSGATEDRQAWSLRGKWLPLGPGGPR